MNFPTLYKKTATGADQFWIIKTEKNSIITQWGQCDGAVQTTTDIIKEGKNVGKANETSAIEQAEAEAKSQWEKKLKKGYVKTLDDARGGKTDEIIQGGIAPMLAHNFVDHAHKIVYPAFAQPKIDGHRCIATVVNGKATLWSRTRKPITGLPHIVADLEKWSNRVNRPNIILDGELYNHKYRDRFEELTGFIRTTNAKPGCEAVEYHVYDIVEDAPFVDRHGILAAFSLGGKLVAVKTDAVADEESLLKVFEQFLAQGYEGCMVRNMRGRYVNKRSYDLQKMKEFLDEEFLVVEVEEGRGKLAGHAIFVCQTKEEVKFRVKMAGETEALKKYFETPALVVGKQLTVKFQGYTNKSAVPRFPVGVRFRDDF